MQAVVKRKREPEPEPAAAPSRSEGQGWVCAGSVWTDPIVACPGGKGSETKNGCIWNGKKYVICHLCKNTYGRFKRADKKKNKVEN